MSAQPAISVILPTWNRRKTVLRAIASVQAQHCTDWELIVVDDGSTDGTADLLNGLDARLRLIRQPNAGAAAARNAGLRAARGEFIAFLDSDDEWLPHFLALTLAFLRAHPQRAWVATEFLAGHGGHAAHGPLCDLYGLRHEFLPLARRLGSRALDLPAGETDDYRRLYAQRLPLDPWGRAPLAGLPADWQRPGVYAGPVGEHYRWGYLYALWCILVRREAALAVGDFPTQRRSCNDYAWLARLARRHEAALIALPGAIKHSLAQDDTESAGHLASRGNTLRFLETAIEAYREAFPACAQEPELRQLLGHRHLLAARAALMLGERARARTHLREAGRHLALGGEGWWLALLAHACPHAGLMRRLGLATQLWHDARARRDARRLERRQPTPCFGDPRIALEATLPAAPALPLGSALAPAAVALR